MLQPHIYQHRNGEPRSAPASVVALTTAAKMAGKSVPVFDHIFETPAALITASQLLERIVVLMAELSVPEPEATALARERASCGILEGVRT